MLRRVEARHAIASVCARCAVLVRKCALTGARRQQRLGEFPSVLDLCAEMKWVEPRHWARGAESRTAEASKPAPAGTGRFLHRCVPRQTTYT